MNGKLSWAIFWALVGLSAVIASAMAIPAFRELLKFPVPGGFITVLGIPFTLLGGALIYFTVREKVGGMLKKFLLLTGASAAGFFVFAVLHNAFYALGIITSHITLLSQSMEVFHVAFFIMAIPVCPIGFLVGAVGSVVLFIKRRRR